MINNFVSTNLNRRVIAIGTGDLQWPFSRPPYITTRPRHPKAHGYAIDVDPFPCYPHDTALVRETAARVESLFPMGWMPNYYLLPFEEVGRTNGHSNRHSIYIEGEDPSPYEPYIVLSGKRIPLHPAM